MNNYGFIILFLIVSIMVMTMGCTMSDTRDPYSEVVIVDKFYQSQPMFGVDPSRVPDGAGYNHDYYIRYSTNGMLRVGRVSKEVYASVFETNTYILKWGYIKDFDSIENAYGYISVVSQVK